MYWCTVDSLFKWGHEKLIAYSSLRSFDLWIVRYNCNSILGGKFIKWLRFCRTESETSISNITNPNYKYIFTAEILNGLLIGSNDQRSKPFLNFHKEVVAFSWLGKKLHFINFGLKIWKQTTGSNIALHIFLLRSFITNQSSTWEDFDRRDQFVYLYLDLFLKVMINFSEKYPWKAFIQP